MTSLLVKDLSLAHPLDREAASTVQGGESRLAGPDIAPGGCMPWPWPIAAMPAMPVMPAMPIDSFPPCGHNPDASDPVPTDRVIRL